MKKLLIGLLVLAGCAGFYYTQSHNKDLHLKVIQECNLECAGNECTEKYGITNTTGIDLDGSAVVDVDYEGQCGNEFDGIGLNVEYNNLTSEWNNNSISFSGFVIPTGQSFSELLIQTHPALCPGLYSYTFTLTGSGEYSSGNSSYVYVPPAQTIFEGDLIRNPDDEGMLQFDIYIVKYVGNKKFKRLILNPHVFESYEHLNWENVQLVEHNTMNSFETSSLVRVWDYDKGVFENEVYKLFPNGDVGIKRHLNMSKSEFESRGYDADSIYGINIIDRDAYITGEEIK